MDDKDKTLQTASSSENKADENVRWKNDAEHFQGPGLPTYNLLLNRVIQPDEDDY